MPPDLESLYHEHRDWVVNLAWRLTGDRELALDVLQEIRTRASVGPEGPTERYD